MSDWNAAVVQVIRTYLTTRGSGRGVVLGDPIDDPIRRVEQYWTLDGRLLFEFDPEAPREAKP